MYNSTTNVVRDSVAVWLQTEVGNWDVIRPCESESGEQAGATGRPSAETAGLISSRWTLSLILAKKLEGEFKIRAVYFSHFSRGFTHICHDNRRSLSVPFIVLRKFPDACFLKY